MNSLNKFSNVLVLAPHTDDGELGCGGTIAKLAEDGKNIFVATFSLAEDSIPKEFPKSQTKTEFINAMDKLGVRKENVIIFNYRVRNFPNFRQDILEDLIKLKNKINPDLVFLPSINDIHQDHQVIANEGLRAFKRVTIFGYELPWNNVVFETRCFVKLNDNHIAKKIEALKCYETQKHRAYLDADFIKGLAKTRGTQIEAEWAESFEVVRFVV